MKMREMNDESQQTINQKGYLMYKSNLTEHVNNVSKTLNQSLNNTSQDQNSQTLKGGQLAFHNMKGVNNKLAPL